jgi:hypothetical protein
MAQAATLDDVEYQDVTPPGDGTAASEDKPGYVALSKRKPRDQFRILKGNVLADLDASSKWREQATEDLGFVAGEQLTEEDKQLLDEQGRPHIVFNRVETILKAIAGMEINGRHEIQFLPRNNEDTEVNEVLSAGSKWMADGCDAEDEQSEAFQNALITGIGVAEARFSFEDEPEGSYVEEQIDCREFVWDRTARKKNLRDARRMARLRRMPLSDAMDLFPGKTKLEIDAVWANNTYLDKKTLKSIEEKRIRDGNDSEDEFDDRNEVTVVVIQWREKEIYYRVADVATNTIQEFSEAEHNLMQARLGMMAQKSGNQIALHSRKATRWAYYQAFLGNEKLLDPVAPAPCGKQFSWGVITGAYDAKKRMWYGLVRVMRDPQMWANKFMSQIMQIMNSTAKGGILAEGDAFDDQKEAEESYAQPEAITWMAPGALSGQKPKIMPKPGQGDASAYVNLLQFAISSIKDVTGINLELLGQQDQNQPGILEHMRKQAGMTVLATMFDSLRGFLKIIGDKRLFYLQKRVPVGTFMNVVGGNNPRVVQLAQEHKTGRYSVIVDDAPTSPNQKEANWAVIQPMLVAFKDQLMGNPEILAMILEYSPLPSQLVGAVKKAILQAKQDPQEAQYAETMKQLAIGKLTAEINKDQSIAEMNNAKAGSTSATAAYDLAMAQNLLAKNDIEGFNHHITAMAEAAKAAKAKADAAKSTVQAQRELVGIHTDLQQHAANLQQANTDAATSDTNNAVAIHQAVTDRLQVHMDGAAQHKTAAINHLSALAGAHRDIAAAYKDRKMADNPPQPQQAA